MWGVIWTACCCALIALVVSFLRWVPPWSFDLFEDGSAGLIGLIRSAAIRRVLRVLIGVALLLLNAFAPFLPLFLAVSLISIGALALCKLPEIGVRDPLPSVNLFWELGCFAYGLWWLEIHEN